MVGIGNNDPVKVMLVDDSAIIRGLYRRMVAQDTDVEVVSDAGNGQQAIDRLKNNPVDVIVLDIEMPVMDGLTAIPHLLKIQPNVVILMASTLTARNADISLQAMIAGAADYIEKPSSNNELTSGQDFKTELLRKIKTLGATAQRRAAPRNTATSSASRSPTADSSKVSVKQKSADWVLPSSSNVTLRRPGVVKPRVLAIGSSTGGPQALATVFEKLPKSLGIPIVVAQHMPPTFTKTLADRIAKHSEWNCREAEDGEELRADTILIAPGGFHMLIAMDGAKVVARLNQEPAENFCRPSVDPLFRSVAAVYGSASLALILTGMGHDGRDSGGMIVERGGTLFAQDEDSSVVWGMPGAVATAGLCSKVIPLNAVAGEISNFVTRFV